MDDSPEILKTLEFDKLKEIVSTYAFSVLGREEISDLSPGIGRDSRERSIGLVREFRNLMNSQEIFPVPSDTDLRPIISKIKEGSYYLQLDELILAGTATKEYKTVGAFLCRLPEEYRGLRTIAKNLRSLPDLDRKVRSIIDEGGRIKDSASRELKSIRDGFRSMHKKLLRTAEKLVKEKKSYLSEEIFTTKDERIVLPVGLSHRKEVPGIVHSSSQSQNTVFIEPLELVEMNNEYSSFRMREEREIRRILRSLTEIIIENIHLYENGVGELRTVDYLYGLASFSEEFRCSPPSFSPGSKMDIRGGRHPLLLVQKGSDGVVPFDVNLGKGSTLLLISGPNMGGKTVLLKSIGVITVMAHAGMHIPAREDSVIPEVDSLYADIGDEQSIERDISTFSSHIRNISLAIEKATENSLILLDEVGVGTDPEEGMGIAMAVLEDLAEKGCLTFATTHYGKLKHFVAGKEGMVNGSMDFDVEKGTPTYHLTFGIPGSSHGFAIAEKVGFPKRLLNRAKSFIDQKELKTDELICNLEQMTREVGRKEKVVQEEREKLQRLLSEYEEKNEKMRKEESEFIKSAREKSLEIVYATRKEMENLIRSIRESDASKREIKESKEKIEEKISELESITEEKPEVDSELSVGDNVFSHKLNCEGIVREILDGYARVESNGFRFVAPLDSLEVREKRTGRDSESYEIITESPTGDEIDVRGLLVDEATVRTIKFIDNAILSNISVIRIIHGKGTGALRGAIKELLREDKRIAEYRLGHWNEGGDGVTIATIKK
jgi:DNA mismatch repair protein MutS2